MSDVVKCRIEIATEPNRWVEIADIAGIDMARIGLQRQWTKLVIIAPRPYERLFPRWMTEKPLVNATIVERVEGALIEDPRWAVRLLLNFRTFYD